MSEKTKTPNGMEVISVLKSFPYFVLRKEMDGGYNLYVQELKEIQEAYLDYEKGAQFYTEGSSGDYVPSDVLFKQIKILIDKEARFMFSRTPDITISTGEEVGAENRRTMQEQYAAILKKVLEESDFPKKLLQSAKDCFIGKRVAMLVDFSEEEGIRIRFYSPLQFYYETDYNGDRLTKFITFERTEDSKMQRKRRYLVNRYTMGEQYVSVSSVLYDGSGKPLETLIEETETRLEEIPAVVIVNGGTLENSRGESEAVSLSAKEQGYSRLANGDIDSDRKGMNPIRYTVDMSPKSTKSLPSGPGAYWDLHSDQNVNESHPAVGALAPEMNHTEAVKTTLDRIEKSMYAEVDVPNITEETMAGTITSGKALRALYWPLTVRCDEKMQTWGPALQKVVRFIIRFALLNVQECKEYYKVTDLRDEQFNVTVENNYALLDDETEEKTLDLDEVLNDTRSRKSYIKKWRGDELTDEEIEEELLQIAVEKNMLDTLSSNTVVQNRLDTLGIRSNVRKAIEEE